VSRGTACVVAALVAAASCALGGQARAQNTGTIAAPERARLVIVGTTRPSRVEVVTVGAGPARAEMDRAVRDVVGALPELTWIDGDAGADDRASQVLIDVTDRVRVRIVAKGAPSSTEPSEPPPLVREVVIAGLSPDVARETVAQIVQTTVQALLVPDSDRDVRAPALEPPPVQPPGLETSDAPAVDSDDSSPRPPRKARRAPASERRVPIDALVGAIMSVSRDTFPFDSHRNLSRLPSLGGIVLSVGQRHSFLTTSVRLSGEWGTEMAGGELIDAQVVMASGGASAHLDLGPLSFALGAEAGAIVAHQQASVPILLGGYTSNWWSGPLVAIRGSVDLRLFSGIFLRAEAGSPAVWVEPKHDDANTVWHYHRYTQVMAAAGYSL
jgi:hypothetical protein